MGSSMSVTEPGDLPTESRKTVLGGVPTLEAIVDSIKSGKVRRIIVAVGAGASVSAGIPDFRSPGIGLYDNLQKYDLPTPESIFTLEYFLEKPDAFCVLSRELLPGKFKPTPAHRFLAILEAKGLLQRVFTQNIDGLERLAGIPKQRLVEAHGSFADAYCAVKSCRHQHSLSRWREEIVAGRVPRCGKIHAIEPPPEPPSIAQVEILRSDLAALEAEKKEAWDKVPSMTVITELGMRCAKLVDEIKKAEEAQAAYPALREAWEAGPKTRVCDGPVKPAIVFFGEALPPRFSFLAKYDGFHSDLLIVMGTSLAVMPFAGILGHVGPLCPRLLLNREAAGLHSQSEPPMFFGNIGFRFDDPENYRDVFVAGEIDTSVARLCSMLGWQSELEQPSSSAFEQMDLFRTLEEEQATQEEFGGTRHTRCVSELLPAIDTDGDGFVSFEEFQAARSTLLEVGVNFLPDFESFSGSETKDYVLTSDAFVDGFKRIFDIVGAPMFDEEMDRILVALGVTAPPVGMAARTQVPAASKAPPVPASVGRGRLKGHGRSRDPTPRGSSASRAVSGPTASVPLAPKEKRRNSPAARRSSPKAAGRT
eukprot:TRINITY_DN43406_c0_g1_i1.p1 TRINITY_DN43406_c0_g1~~TRINITY_DN43406_c0_g1_i1.p1  ORF type:complete len:592 (+),score=92.98 TRINITY_DN43406_c0_g1_i1:134-1909(+)